MEPRQPGDEVEREYDSGVTYSVWGGVGAFLLLILASGSALILSVNLALAVFLLGTLGIIIAAPLAGRWRVLAGFAISIALAVLIAGGGCAVFLYTFELH